jgi:LPS sulfotransferase NodH
MSESPRSWPRLPEELPPVRLGLELRGSVRLRLARLRSLISGNSDGQRKLLIFGQGRTGSTLLGDLLASHPQFHFGNELLRARTRWPAAYLEGLRAAHEDKVFCAHVKPYHLTDFQDVEDVAGWLRRMHDNGWVIAHLQRHDVVRHALSNFSRNAVGVSHFTSTDARRTPRLVVDPAELLTWVDARSQIAAWERELLAGLEHHVVVYERDLQQPEQWQPTANRLWAAVGLTPVPVMTQLRKINPQSLRDLLVNYDEVASSLEGTAYAQFL